MVTREATTWDSFYLAFTGVQACQRVLDDSRGKARETRRYQRLPIHTQVRGVVTYTLAKLVVRLTPSLLWKDSLTVDAEVNPVIPNANRGKAAGSSHQLPAVGPISSLVQVNAGKWLRFSLATVLYR